MIVSCHFSNGVFTVNWKRPQRITFITHCWSVYYTCNRYYRKEMSSNATLYWLQVLRGKIFSKHKLLQHLRPTGTRALLPTCLPSLNTKSPHHSLAVSSAPTSDIVTCGGPLVAFKCLLKNSALTPLLPSFRTSECKVAMLPFSNDTLSAVIITTRCPVVEGRLVCCGHSGCGLSVELNSWWCQCFQILRTDRGIGHAHQLRNQSLIGAFCQSLPWCYWDWKPLNSCARL